MSWSEDQVALLRQLAITGATATQIAAVINRAFPGQDISHSAVLNKARRLKISIGGSGSAKEKAANYGKRKGALRRVEREKEEAARAAEKAKVKVKAPAAPKMPRDPLPPERKPFRPTVPHHELTSSQCAWIFGPSSASAPACGAPIKPHPKGMRFCAKHMDIAFGVVQWRRAA